MIVSRAISLFNHLDGSLTNVAFSAQLPVWFSARSDFFCTERTGSQRSEAFLNEETVLVLAYEYIS